MSKRKNIFNAAFFVAVMCLTFYAVFHGQNLGDIRVSVSRMSGMFVCLSVLCAVFFVCAEGFMIWYLLRGMGGKTCLARCICYSFIGFFYSGITPSATGGQPMQLYYMKKDKNRLSDSSVVLMTVAVVYKFVLVVVGALLLLFWLRPLRQYFGGYLPLFLFGLFLNVALVVILTAVMAAPGVMYRLLAGGEKVLVRIGIFPYDGKRTEKIRQFIDGYREAVDFLVQNKGKVCFVVLCTFLQRCSVFLLTAFVYKGFGLCGTSFLTVALLQAAVYIAVDMLPVPGAQGITELLYQSVFAGVFSGGFLMPSLYVTRGINFYFLLLVSLCVVAGNRLYFVRRAGAARKETA